MAGLASVDHHQRLVEAGYRVARLEKERDDLALEVEHRRVRVDNLSSPVRLLGEARQRKLPVDYPLAWNRVSGDAEAARLVLDRAAAMAASKPSAKPAAGKPKKPAARPARPSTARRGGR